MAKKSFIKPVILNSGWGGEGSDVAPGSGGTSTNVTAVTFDEWIEMYGEDMDLDDDIDFDDYRTWWLENELDPALWESFNPSQPLNP